MSVRAHRIHTWICENGERSCYLEERATSLPHFRSLYYVTTQIRGASLSLSAMQVAYNAINVLLDYCIDYKVSLEERFRRKEFLLPEECEALKRHCQTDFDRGRGKSSTNVVVLSQGKKGYRAPRRHVGKSNVRARLTCIASYLKWLASDLLGSSYDHEASIAVERMYANLLELRPKDKGRNVDENDPGLTDEQLEVLRSVVQPGSATNPFKAPQLQLRNKLIVELFLQLGKRTGELLNVRGADINIAGRLLHLRRRPDDKADPRRRQPLVKTLAHSVPLEDDLIELIREYAKARRRVPGVGKTAYLLVTHKSGPTQGQPMTISALQQVFAQIRAADPRLAAFHPHISRHTWNRQLSEDFDKSEGRTPESEEENIRSNLMGWNEGSGTASTYNRRHTKRKAMEAGRRRQQAIHDASTAGQKEQSK